MRHRAQAFGRAGADFWSADEGTCWRNSISDVFYHPVSKEQSPLTCFQPSIQEIKCGRFLVTSEHLSQRNAGLVGMLIFLVKTLSSLKHAFNPTLFIMY